MQLPFVRFIELPNLPYFVHHSLSLSRQSLFLFLCSSIPYTVRVLFATDSLLLFLIFSNIRNKRTCCERNYFILNANILMRACVFVFVYVEKEEVGTGIIVNSRQTLFKKYRRKVSPFHIKKFVEVFVSIALFHSLFLLLSYIKFTQPLQSVKRDFGCC